MADSTIKPPNRLLYGAFARNVCLTTSDPPIPLIATDNTNIASNPCTD
ncbi:MAG: hypothetical protein OXI70_04170 [Chloroflexota bacterium]|nr:hypothetical protein [Chloroflexota bacterium]